MSTTEIRKDFGAELRAKRISMRLKYREAAAKGHLSISMVRFLEMGKIERPSVATIRGMHQIYGIRKKLIEKIYFG